VAKFKMKNMENRELQKIIQKVKSWRDLANQQNDYFIKFALEYFAFNALLRLNFSMGELERDRNLIERLKGCANCKRFISATYIGELKTLLDEKPLKNLTRNKNIKINNNKDWNNIVESVYWLRNNLFHGHKGIIERDQKLVEAGYKILKDIDNHLLGNIGTP
jgi:hypothetical protein